MKNRKYNSRKKNLKSNSKIMINNIKRKIICISQGYILFWERDVQCN